MGTKKGRRANKNHEDEAHLDFLNLSLQPTNIRITLRRRLVQLHDADQRIRIILQHTHDTLRLMMQQHLTPRLQQVLVHIAHNANIELRPTRRTDNRMVVVHDLLHGPHRHGAPPEIVHAAAVLLVLLLAGMIRGLEELLIRDELLLKEEVVLDAIELEELEAAAGSGVDGGELGGRRGPLAFLFADAGGEGGFPFLLSVLWVFFGGVFVGRVGGRETRGGVTLIVGIIMVKRLLKLKGRTIVVKLN